jgi:hypothetical protein
MIILKRKIRQARDGPTINGGTICFFFDPGSFWSYSIETMLSPTGVLELKILIIKKI